MHKVTILGAGKMGTAIAKLLHQSGDYAVRVGDTDLRALERLSASIAIETVAIDVSDEIVLADNLKGQDSVVSACPFWVNAGIARAALKVGASYFDLTEDVTTTATIQQVAREAAKGQVFMPQCGLAPGFISILAHHLCQGFDTLEEVKMRVGALPLNPTNMLKYNLTWSTDGLINQYCNPCPAIRNSQLTEVSPLDDLEHFSLDGIEYEAFNTSGGLGTLCETLKGKVRNLNYKSVRYKGHRYLMTFLVKELGLGDRREILKDILEKAVPITFQDVVLIFCSVSGWKEGKLLQVSDTRKIYHAPLLGENWGSIQITTAAGLCAALDLHAAGAFPEGGFTKQEQIELKVFKTNRFGRYYFQSLQEGNN